MHSFGPRAAVGPEPGKLISLESKRAHQESDAPAIRQRD
jgi:hypothetical protein